MSLTQEQKRIKIAEACGWKNHRPEIGKNSAAPWWYRGEDVAGCTTLPDYFNDLNACREMEKTVQGDYTKWQAYLDQLWKTYPKSRRIDIHALLQWLAGEFLTTSAAQRAEAFGLTLKLWETGE